MGGELSGVGTTGHTGYRRVFQRPRTAHHNLGATGLAAQKKTQVRHVSPVCFTTGFQSRHLNLQARLYDTTVIRGRQDRFPECCSQKMKFLSRQRPDLGRAIWRQ